MRKKVWKAAGVFCLFTVLCMSMVGCSGKENDPSNMPDENTLKESGNQEEPKTNQTKDKKEDNNDNQVEGKKEDNNDNQVEGKKEDNNDNQVEDKEVDTSKNSTEDSKDQENNSGIFYDGANLSGRVVDFTDTGFTITPETLIINEDGSMEGGIASPGYESEETNINITYAEEVVFQIIQFSIASQTEISREDTNKSSVKKNTDVNIFGTCEDEKHWIANKVVITRWE